MTVTVLSACGSNGDGTDSSNVSTDATGTTAPPTGQGNAGGGATGAGVHPLTAMDNVLARFPLYVNTGRAHLPGTTFRFGIGASTPWPGMFGGAVFHTSVEEAHISDLIGTSTSLFSTTEFFQFGQDGIVNWSYDLNAGTFTMNMQYDVYWHDGVPLTLNDLVFAYEIIAHPLYDGIRLNDHILNIVGVNEYNNGEVDYISGLVLSNNNRTLTVHFHDMGPSLLYFGIWTAPTPRHIFEHIPVQDMSASPEVRINPIGWGPFKVENIVPGEALSLVRNENYVFGAPLIESMIVERVVPELLPAALEDGRFDLAAFPLQYYHDHQNPTNFTFLGALTGEYWYVSFRLGHWDAENGVNVSDPTRKMANVNLRRAMAYAVNDIELTEGLFHGLQFPAASNVPAHHRALIDESVPGFPFDPDRARELLDEAGFIDIDGDGFREDPNGEQLTIMWAFPTDDNEDIIVQFYIQQWAAVGLRVELWRGRTHDRVYLWDVLDFDNDNDEIDIYWGRWVPGFDPSPAGSWGHVMWNPARYTSPEYDAIIDSLNSSEGWDPQFMQQAYSNWQWYWYNNLPYYPVTWRINLLAVNNRVTRWDTRVQYNLIPASGTSPEFGWHMVGLSAENPYSR